MHEDLLEFTPRNISLDKDKLEVSKNGACASESSEPIEFEKLITLLNIDKAAEAPLVENKKKAYLPSKKSFKMTTLPCKRFKKKECAEGKEEGYNTIARKICKAHSESRFYLEKKLFGKDCGDTRSTYDYKRRRRITNLHPIYTSDLTARINRRGKLIDAKNL